MATEYKLSYTGSEIDSKLGKIDGLVEAVGYLSNYVTPQQYGAVGDGVTDDTEAIQSCINSAGVLSKTIVFPSGKTYRITSTIDLTQFVQASHEKQISGYGAKILVDFEGFAFDCSFDVSNNYNVIVKGLTLNSYEKKGSGFNINYCQLFDFEDCTFNQLSKAIYTTDIYYQNIAKCQFIGCNFGIAFDINKTNGINNVNIDKCRITNCLAGIYVLGCPNSFRVTNCAIEACTYGICGASSKGYGIVPTMFIVRNHLEMNENHLYLSGINFADDFTPIHLNGEYSLSANISQNYYVGNGLNVLGIGDYHFTENHYYNPDSIVVNNGKQTAKTLVYMDDDSFVKVTGNSKMRVRIFTPNNKIRHIQNLRYNQLTRELRSERYFVNAIGSIQPITNTDMLHPLYDDSFNPDESGLYPEKTTIRINGVNHTCTKIINETDNHRNYADGVPAYHNIEDMISSANADNRYFVDMKTGMLIDYATRSYCGTIFGTEITSNPAYGTELPTSPVLYEIFYDTVNKVYKMYNGTEWEDA